MAEPSNVAVFRHRHPLIAEPEKSGSQRADWYLYDVTFRGETIVRDSRVPECDLARALKAKGFTGRVTLLDADTSNPRMEINIEKAAKLNGVSLNTEIHNRLEWSISPMAEEALRLTFPNVAEPLIAAYRVGRLRLRPDDIKRMKAVLNEWVDQFKTAMEG